MRPIATNVVRCVVYLCLFDTRVSFAKTVESIKMPFGDRMVCTHGTMCYTETHISGRYYCAAAMRPCVKLL